MGLVCRVDRRAVFLSGSIDENADLTHVFTTLRVTPGDPLIVNLQGISFVNSHGIRRWMQHMGQLTARRSVKLEAVCYSLAMAARMFGQLMGKAEILSVEAPYVCPECRSTPMLLVNADECQEGVPVRVCSDCDENMQLDEFDDYFQILKPPAS